MPLKEGRCPNCGSLIHLDSSSNQGHCLFCDAVFDNAKAFEIAAKPAGVEFPNLPQPKYEGSLQTTRQGTAPNFPVNQPAARKKQMTKVEPEPYVIKKTKIPDIKVSLRVKVMIGVILVGIAVIFAAVMIPLSIRRDKDRIAILAALPSVSPIAIESESAAALRRVDNSYLMVATGATVTENQAIALFKAFCEKRAEIRGITKGNYNQVYGGMTLRLAYAGGGFLIDHPDQAALASGKAVEPLQ